mmetsp:Transcript_80876/g.160731  ORF Transcript_80876/g.160731 Transcript_80876/m.160731 type:complete len:127 (-) Transcript_80876:316-696(-)
MHSKPAAVAGQCFCISNMEPCHSAQEFYDALSFFYEQRFKAKMPHEYMPPRLMTCIGYVVEGIQRLTRRRLSGDIALVTPAMSAVACLSYVFSSSYAEAVLGYKPLYNLDQAIQKTVHLWDVAGKP